MARVTAKAEEAAQPPTPTAAPVADPWGASAAREGVPELAGTTRGQIPFPMISPQPPFWLVYIPDRWGVMAGRMIPMLAKLSTTPGTNGVDRTKAGRSEMSLAFAGLEREGRKAIPHDVDGPGRSYLVSVDVGDATNRLTGAPVKITSWHTRFEKLYPGSSDIHCDEGSYSAWVRGLVDRGVLAPPRPYVFEKLIGWLSARIGHYRGKGRGDHPQVKAYEADLAVVKAERERITKSLQPVATTESVPEV
jgi:hypothetical protein